jgi:anti-sigma factor RsiW
MRANHPEIMLVPYLRSELDAEERRRIERHMSSCARCRAAADAYSLVLDEVARAGATITWPDWTSYDAQLRRKIAARASTPHRPYRQLLFGSLLGAAAAATIALVMLLPAHPRQSAVPGVDQLTMESEIGNVDIGLMRAYPVIEHLDLLENYEVIDHLDQVQPADSHAARS